MTIFRASTGSIYHMCVAVRQPVPVTKLHHICLAVAGLGQKLLHWRQDCRCQYLEMLNTIVEIGDIWDKEHSQYATRVLQSEMAQQLEDTKRGMLLNRSGASDFQDTESLATRPLRWTTRRTTQSGRSATEVRQIRNTFRDSATFQALTDAGRSLLWQPYVTELRALAKH